SRAFAARLTSAVADCDAVILSDYGSGLITPAVAERLRAALGRRSRNHPPPLLVDSRYRLLAYRGVTTCTPNESEVEQMLGGLVVMKRGTATISARELSTAVAASKD